MRRRVFVRYSRARGVALITAVLVVAVISVAAAGMAVRSSLDVRRTANVIDTGRAYMFALGVESWVRYVLVRDKRDNPNTDNLGEDWAVQLPPIPVEGATLTGRVEDMQGRFNLNNLVDNTGKPSTLDVERFRRLLGALQIDTAITDAVIDWIDPDSDVSFPGGAEDVNYMSTETPYRAANRMFVSPSELLLVKGVTADIYRQLAPHVSALPMHDAAINVNTAGKEVLMTVAEGVTKEDAEALIEARGDKGFSDMNAFLNNPVLTAPGRTVDKTRLALISDYFLLDANAQFGRGQVRLFSLLHRDAKGVIALMRAQGTYQ